MSENRSSSTSSSDEYGGPGRAGRMPGTVWATGASGTPEPAGTTWASWADGGGEAREPRRARRRRRRASGPVAVLAAVAVAAGAIGGGTGALIAGLTDGGAGTVAAGGPVAGSPISVDADATVADVAAAVAPSVVEIATATSTGSGVVVSEDGEILTNHHVVSGADRVQITFSDGSTAEATVAGSDPGIDLALLRAEDVGGLTPAALGDSADVAIGDQVVAIGSPAGLSGTVTSGIVSALEREVTVQQQSEDSMPWGDPWGSGPGRGGAGGTGATTSTYRAIQTDAALNPGNSGGALVNMAGQVIGINSALYSPTGEAGSVGLGFAIPVNDAKDVLAQLRTASGTTTAGISSPTRRG
ncbi:S1C family serine protease [Streptomyces aidingensis]|uniref:Putative serine protease PepD n=1 Tax=Streptomyces aidingensis TaxID=910347 RepID=A0A1I1HQC7_9ACTN|nr:trypsin-like peptidase domain-containing protein [Streptomyces aidingensis]SFC25782.1 putative serine protease PepD [Streptomyces aidingensis]